jgi:hypothetical protein
MYCDDNGPYLLWFTLAGGDSDHSSRRPGDDEQ